MRAAVPAGAGDLPRARPGPLTATRRDCDRVDRRWPGVSRRYAWGSATAIPRAPGRVADRRAGGRAVVRRPPRRPVARARARPGPGRGDRRRSGRPARSGRRRPVRRPAAVPAQVAGRRAATVDPGAPEPGRRPGPASRAEDARGVARDAPERNYRDANHKPELLCALTQFDALCGFRPVAGDAAPVRRARPCAELDRSWRRCWAAGRTAGRVHRAAHARRTGAARRGGRRRAPCVADIRPSSRPPAARVGRCAQATSRATSAPCCRCCSTHVRLAPGEAIFLGRGQRARLPARDRRRDHGQQRQRAALRPDAQAHRRRRTAARSPTSRALPEPRWRADGRRRHRRSTATSRCRTSGCRSSTWPLLSPISQRRRGRRRQRPAHRPARVGRRRSWPIAGPARSELRARATRVFAARRRSTASSSSRPRAGVGRLRRVGATKSDTTRGKFCGDASR